MKFKIQFTSHLPPLIFAILLFVCCSSVAAQNNVTVNEDKLLPPDEETFQKTTDLITPWANIICQISDKEVNPPNCPDKKTPEIWTVASSLTLYSDNGTAWFNFSLDTNNPKHFLKSKKEEFLPFSTEFDDEGFTLRMVAESPNWYEVEVNEATQATKFILKSDPLWMKVTWNYFLAKVRVLSFDGENKPQFFDKPNGELIEESSETMWDNVRFKLKTEGEWALVEGYLPPKNYQGWIKWRKGREILFESKLFRNKFNRTTPIQGNK